MYAHRVMHANTQTGRPHLDIQVSVT